MKTLCVCGKKYNDTVLLTESIVNGTTNSCKDIIKKQGGVNNLLQVDYQYFKPEILYSGLKDAYILSSSVNSDRTSFVLNKQESKLISEDVNSINKFFDWLHIAYIDDFEDLVSINHISIDYSVDFCTENDRYPYIDIINKASIVFDSRERKDLYSNISSQTPIILHDQYGFEIIVMNTVVYQNNMTPIKNLHVNGAGDIFAGITIDNYFNETLSETCNIAMRETTKILRRNNEKI